MLIGIDMIGVQSPGAGDRETGRYGRQLVRALLARDPVNRYVLYLHEGLPTDPIPPAPNALRVTLSSASGRAHSRRSTTQRLLDRDPQGLDWLILLDPFSEAYGGLPPEAPLNGPMVASVVHDLAPTPGEDRRLIPLRRHDAVLAICPEIASAHERMMGLNGHRVSMIGLATDETFSAPGSSEPLTQSAGVELGRLGVHGPFVLTRVPRSPSRAGLAAALEPYRRLPIERRRRFQLVVTGPVDDPASIRSFLREHGADEGLVLAGAVTEPALAMLYGRCSAFLAPTEEGASGLALVEAMRCGAPVIGVHSPSRSEILGDAALLVGSSDPSRLGSALEDLLSDTELASDLRLRGLDRSARFSFDVVADALVASLEGTASAAIRPDRSHGIRPRIAVFLDIDPDSSSQVDVETLLPIGWPESFAIDVYLRPGLATLADSLPAEFGGFDARLFDRNDAILGYHAVVYFLDGTPGVDENLDRLRRRPGLVVLGDGAWLDRVGSIPPAHGFDPGVARLRDLFQTGSRVVVRSPGLLDRIAGSLPEYVDQLVEIPPSREPVARPDAFRIAARRRLDLLPDWLAIGLFGRWEASADAGRISRALEAVARAIPDAVFFGFDSDSMSIDDRFLRTGALSPEEAGDVIPALDLAIHFEASETSTVPGLLRAGIPTIAIEADPPERAGRDVAPSDVRKLRRLVVALASDPEARSARVRSAQAGCFGTPDPLRASKLLLEQVERCASEIQRGSGRRTPKAQGAHGQISTPHFPRAASARGEAASRLR